MNIQYYGDYCFKISTKPAGRATEDVIVWTDPPEKGTGLRSPYGQADIVFVTHGDSQESGKSFKGNPVILDGPGEYSVRGITAFGFPTYRDAAEGAERGNNTVFVFESEDIHVAFLGAIGHELDPDTLDKMNGVDVLFIPAGGNDTIAAKTAAEMTRKIEPGIVIPMHYQIPGLSLAVGNEQEFCKAMSSCPQETVSKLNLKKKDLEGKMLQVVLLERGA